MKSQFDLQTVPVAEWLRVLIFHYCTQTFDHLTAVSGVATFETSQFLLAGVSGGFSRGFPVFAPPVDWPVSYELKENGCRSQTADERKWLPIVCLEN